MLHIRPSVESEVMPQGLPSVCLWNPEGFEPADYLGESLKSRADLARFVVHKIIWSNVFKLADKRGFAPLKAAYLREFFPDNGIHSQVMKALVQSNAIICDGRYVVGEKCLGYKLGPALTGRRHRRVPITNRKLAEKVVRRRADFPKTLRGVHRHLFDHLVTVEIDRESALRSLLQGDFQPTDETAVEFIHARHFHFHRCDYGRVHTNLTNLKSELRRFLSVRGERLVNLDIRNSQPLIFASILKRQYEFDPAQTDSPAPEDVLKYVDLVQAGSFYDHLMEASGLPADRRSEFKRRFFGRVFFCENWPRTPEAELFGATFPNVLAVIHKLKFNDYRALSHELQRAESGIMIDGVATRCMNDMPHVFIGTIHDSVLTTPQYADAIKDMMADEFGNAGLCPTIQVEPA